MFLVRAGDATESNWPVTWELRSSDNGVLFQVMQDVAAGRALDWSFSPQVYVFPELPISAVAYLASAGNVYGYYLAVAILNNSLLFLAILGTIRLIFPHDRVAGSIARAALASTPLLLFPLVGTAWILSFPLAPTYYFGMYLVLLGAPALVLVRGPWLRAAVVVGVALAAASNPLMLVFALPALGVCLLAVLVRRGLRAALRAAIPVGAALLLAAALRLLVFAPLQGTSPLTYVDPEVFAERWRQLGPYFAWVTTDVSSRVILGLGAVLAIVCLAGAITVVVGFLRGRLESRHLGLAYLGFIPVLGIAATAAVLITHYLYFWPALILPFVVVLMVMPAQWAIRALPGAAAVLLATGLVTGAASNLGHQERYFGHRADETRCIDENLPPGVELGYATFSDARRLSLPSQRPFRMIQLRSDGAPSYWLTNRSYVTSAPGQFFYLNGRGDEWPIDAGFITGTFGEPDDRFACGPDQEVLVYTDPAKRAAIAAHYGAERR